MQAELERLLLERYPELYADDGSDPRLPSCGVARGLGLIDGGFACGDGWYDIIERLSKTLAAMRRANDVDFRVVQVKSKFGTLRVYTSPRISDPEAIWLEGVLQGAAEESARTCEVCGRPGTTLAIGGWYSTLCGTHIAEEQARMAALDEED